MKIKKYLSKTIYVFIFFIYFDKIYSYDTSSLKVNYFIYNNNLYYVNVINNDKGNIYIEYWGDKNILYLIGINGTTGEELYFGNNKEKQITINSDSTYHDSIMLNYNNNEYILSINYKTFDLINIDTGEFKYKATEDIFFADQGKPGYGCSVIKLKNNNFLLSMILKEYGLFKDTHEILISSFYFTPKDIINKIENYKDSIDYTNSTNCFQTENLYIQCSYNRLLGIHDYLTVGIFDYEEIEEIKYYDLDTIIDTAFIKIFHIKEEIGAYVYFHLDTNYPKIQIKKLNTNEIEFIDMFEIVLNADGKYSLNNGLFNSDAIKINDSKFTVIFTSENFLNLLICMFDLYNNDQSLRLRYFYLPLEQINIKILDNLRAFKIGNFLGITFFNTNLKYPGYTLFNFPNFITDNNYSNNTSNEIEIFIDSSSYSFNLQDNILLMNNVFGGEITKIKIISFEDKSNSGVVIKSYNLDYEISINQEIDFNDKLIFEQVSSGAFPGKYLLEFSLIIKELNYNEEDSLADVTKYYVDTTSYYQSKTYESNILKLIYKVKCYKRCKTCSQLGSESFYYCIQCLDEFPFNINNGEKCVCYNYTYIDGNLEEYCTPQCDNFKYTAENEKYCLSSCFLNNEELYLDEENKICYKNCSDNPNGNIYTYLKSCVNQCPTNYSSDINNVCVPDSIKTNLPDSLIIEHTNNIESSSLNKNHETPKTIDINNNEDKGKLSNDNKYNNLSLSEIKYNGNINQQDNKYQDKVNLIIRKFIDNNSKLEIEQINNDNIVSCYSSETNLNTLIELNPNLTYIDLKECVDQLITDKNLNTSSELIVVTKEYTNKSFPNNFEYELYTKDEKKIGNLSMCDNTNKIISAPIKDKDKINYNTAEYLSKQGYDIYNKSSSFYYDYCLSAYINESDLPVSLRQQEIYPNNISLCADGCVYQDTNYKTQRLNCICNTDIIEEENNFIEVVKTNFFIYIADMINYKITTCYQKFFDLNNYSYNLGLYIGAFLFFLFIIIYVIYCCKGKRSIRKQYFDNEPNMNEIKQIELNFNKINLLKNSHKKIRNGFSSSITINNYIKKQSNPLKKNKKSKGASKKKKKTRNNYLKKNGEILTLSPKIINSSNSNIVLKNFVSFNKNIEKTTSDNKINYDELYFYEAIEKDKRNFFEIFKSLFILKLQTIQIIFYPKEFTHLSLTMALYLFDILLDITINSLLFSDYILTQKYFNNGDLLFITTNVLSISSNIISYFILYFLEKLINQYKTLEVITKEFKSTDNFLIIFNKLNYCFELKISIFFIILFLVGLFCTYYLFIFFSIYINIQIDLFINYIVGSIWSLVATISISFFIAITRKISIIKKIKRLFIISKFIDDIF